MWPTPMSDENRRARASAALRNAQAAECPVRGVATSEVRPESIEGYSRAAYQTVAAAFDSRASVASSDKGIPGVRRVRKARGLASSSPSCRRGRTRLRRGFSEQASRG